MLVALKGSMANKLATLITTLAPIARYRCVLIFITKIYHTLPKSLEFLVKRLKAARNERSPSSYGNASINCLGGLERQK